MGTFHVALTPLPNIMNKSATIKLYSKEELLEVQEHIKTYFGQESWYYQYKPEEQTEDLPIYVLVIEPTPQRDYYVLVTLGLGSYYMPSSKVNDSEDIHRVELCMALSSNWKPFLEDSRKTCWPLNEMYNLSRSFNPESNDRIDIGIGLYGTSNNETFAGSVYSDLIPCTVRPYSAQYCELSSGDKVYFLSLLALLPQESDFLHEGYACPRLLLDRIAQDSKYSSLVQELPVNPLTRPDMTPPEHDPDPNADVPRPYFPIEAAYYHIENIAENNLPLDEIVAYNNISVLLRFAIEKGLMTDLFVSTFPEVIDDVIGHHGQIDLRRFIRDEYDGNLYAYLFTEEGLSFLTYVCTPLADCAENEPHNFDVEVDSYAEEYFTQVPWLYDERRRDEAYLFVPFNDIYYFNIKKKLDTFFEMWQADKAAGTLPDYDDL